ncbi:MAG: YgeY family selenium metabolism-linked hydrolase, partial [Chloroflexi bacterium]
MFTLSRSDREELVEFLQDLIRTPSPSTQEEAVAIRIAAAMRRVGFREVFTDRIGNVIGRYGSGRGPILLYNGHMDTVGISDPEAWQRDPYGGEIEDGIIYGRGVADMKGAIAAMIYGVKMLAEARVRLKGDLVVACVVQEEPCEGLAMRVLIEEEGLRPDWVVLGEATNLQISRGHRGRLEMQVTTHGRSCHASNPDLGENAIYAAARLIFGLELLADKLGYDPFLGRGTLAVTHVESSASSRNAIPDRASFIIDRRLTLGETEAKALSEVQGIILREGVRAEVEVTEYRATSYTGYEARQRAYYPAWALEEGHPLIKTLARTIRNTLGYRPTVGQWAFSTDGAYTMGVAGIPTAGFGPGEERYAHTADEQLRLE